MRRILTMYLWTSLSSSRVVTPGCYALARHGARARRYPAGLAHELNLSRGFDYYHIQIPRAFSISAVVASMVGWFSTRLELAALGVEVLERLGLLVVDLQALALTVSGASSLRMVELAAAVVALALCPWGAR